MAGLCSRSMCVITVVTNTTDNKTLTVSWGHQQVAPFAYLTSRPATVIYQDTRLRRKIIAGLQKEAS